MHIAVDISPIDSSSNSAHKVRGVGKYIQLLKDNIEQFDKNNTYIFTSSPQKVHADLIHYPYFDPFFVTLPFNKNTKTVVTVHDVIPLLHKKNFPVGIKGTIKWQINRMLLKRVDAILTDSLASRQDIEKVVGYDGGKIFPVYLTADEVYRKMNLTQKDKEILREKYGLPERFFVYVGDVTWNKNLPRLIEAVKKVNVPLVMVGKALADTDFDRANPWNKDRIFVLDKTTDHTLFLKPGFVSNEDLVKIYNLAMALVMPSIDEGFGLPILEAMSCGCPVVVSRGGSLPEVAGDAAIYVDKTSSSDIAEKLAKVYKDKSLRMAMQQKGIEQAQKFSLKKMIDQTVQVYNSI